MAAALAAEATPPVKPKTVFGFSRVDILSEDPGFWINDELPNVLAYPLRPALRFVMQVKVVWSTPVRGLTIGTSVSSQSVHYERNIFGFESVTVGAGLQTALLLPRGLWVDVAWHRGPYRLALGLSTISDASWGNLRWDSWRFLPTVGVGIGLPDAPKGGD
jgi:hypothetical protein